MTATRVALLAQAPSRRLPDAVRVVGSWLRLTSSFAIVLAALAFLWEGYKALGRATGDTIPGTSMSLPVATDDLAMPHLWSIARALAEPANRASDTSLGSYLLSEAFVTVREALYGLCLGALVGAALAVLFMSVAPLARGFMPWVVASQVVPLVAIAPMIVIWGGKLGLPSWMAVTGISAYLAFFPVTINTLRGLRSPARVQVELMQSVAAGPVRAMGYLRLPAALPYLFAGLRLAATASVVGAIVGELSAGTGRGIGRAILTFTYYYSNGPEKLYASVFVAALAGIAFVQMLALLEFLTLRNRRQHS